MVHASIQHLTNGIIPPCIPDRYKLYREIYITCRKLKLPHLTAVEIVADVLDVMEARFKICDPLDAVNTYWYKCESCNKSRHIVRRTGEEYCNNPKCELYQKRVVRQ